MKPIVFASLCWLLGLGTPQQVVAYFTATTTGIMQVQIGDWQSPEVIVTAPLGATTEYIDQTALAVLSGEQSSVTLALHKPQEGQSLPETTLLYLVFSVAAPENIPLTAHIMSGSEVLAEIYLGTTRGKHSLILPLSQSFLHKETTAVIPLTISLDTSILKTATIQLHTATTALVATASSAHSDSPVVAVTDESATELICSDQNTAVTLEQQTATSHTITVQSEGLHQLHCSASDTAGNTTITTFWYALDYSAPSSPVVVRQVFESGGEISLTLEQSEVVTQFHSYSLTLIGKSGESKTVVPYPFLPKALTHLWLEDTVLLVFSTEDMDPTQIDQYIVTVGDAFGNTTSRAVVPF